MKLSHFNIVINLYYCYSTGAGRFAITDRNLYVLVLTLSTQDNAKMFQQLKSDFKRTISWNKYQSDPKTHAKNQYLNHLVEPCLQGVNRVLYYLLKMRMVVHPIQSNLFQKQK